MRDVSLGNLTLLLGSVRTLTLAVAMTAGIVLWGQEAPSSGAEASTVASPQTNAADEKAEDAGSDDNRSEWIEPPARFTGRLCFVNYSTGFIHYFRNGEYVSHYFPLCILNWKAADAGGAVAVGALLGGAIGGAVTAAAAQRMGDPRNYYPEDAVSGLAFFPDGQSFLLCSALGELPTRQVRVDGKKLKKYDYLFGSDLQVMADSNKVLAIKGSLPRGQARIVEIDLKQRKVTNSFIVPGDAPQYSPKLSSDGKQIAFLEGKPGEAQLVLFQIEEQTKRVLVDVAAKPIHVAWSQDGESLFYASLADHQIHQYQLATGEDKTITVGKAQKLFPVAGGKGKLFYCQSTAKKLKGRSIGGLFRLKMLEIETGSVFSVEVPDPTDGLSVVSPIFWQPPVSQTK